MFSRWISTGTSIVWQTLIVCLSSASEGGTSETMENSELSLEELSLKEHSLLECDILRNSSQRIVYWLRQYLLWRGLQEEVLTFIGIPLNRSLVIVLIFFRIHPSSKAHVAEHQDNVLYETWTTITSTLSPETDLSDGCNSKLLKWENKNKHWKWVADKTQRKADENGRLSTRWCYSSEANHWRWITSTISRSATRLCSRVGCNEVANS